MHINIKMNTGKHRYSILTFLLFLMLVNSSIPIYSQGSIGGGENPPPPNNDEGGGPGAGFDDDTQDQIVPIDGLIVVGMIAGSIYGIRRKYKN